MRFLLRAIPLMNKKPETVHAAMRQAIPTLVQDKKDFALTTDARIEFSRLEEGGYPVRPYIRGKQVRMTFPCLIAPCRK